MRNALAIVTLLLATLAFAGDEPGTRITLEEAFGDVPVQTNPANEVRAAQTIDGEPRWIEWDYPGKYPEIIDLIEAIEEDEPEIDGYGDMAVMKFHAETYALQRKGVEITEKMQVEMSWRAHVFAKAFKTVDENRDKRLTLLENQVHSLRGQLADSQNRIRTMAVRLANANAARREPIYVAAPVRPQEDQARLEQMVRDATARSTRDKLDDIADEIARQTAQQAADNQAQIQQRENEALQRSLRDNR